VFASDGDVAPLPELCEVARRRGARLVVDESHAIGCLGPEGRGALAEAGLEGEADLVVCSLGTALGSYGGVIAGDVALLREVAAAGSLAGSAAPTPPASAAALAALAELGDGQRRVAKLQANAGILRDALAGEGLQVTGSDTQVMALAVGDLPTARLLCAAALEEGVVVEAIERPAPAGDEALVRLAVMSSHTRAELAAAAAALGRAARRTGGPRPTGVFDVEARLAA
jgi:glycine C-acetyltransferase/8-amino-7-oxononanoate synthase